MADIVIMPKLGFDMAEGTLVRWVVAEGLPVEKGAVLAEIETDKATVEVESNFSGTVRQHLVEEGTVVPVNQPIAVIGTADESIDVLSLLGKAVPGPAEKPSVAAPQAQAPAEEKSAAPAAKAEPQARTGAPIGVTPAAVAAPAPVEGGQLPGGVRASPVARRMAHELGIDLAKVKGTGPDGRIRRADIEAYQAIPAAAEARLIQPLVAGPAAAKEDRRILLSRLRGAIGRRMVQAKQTVPHFYITCEYDVAALIQLRAQLNTLLPDDEKISVNDFIVKAVAHNLREFPNLNASIDEQKGEVVQHGHTNIGIAVAVENGLLTVVCRNADLKSLHQIAVEVRGLVQRARDGKVKPEDIEGSTFSVSNLGMYGVEEFIAIINPPEAAILAIGSAQEVPVIKEGQIQVGTRMKATISVDHRVSDGAEAARFMQALARYLEEPLRLVI